MRLHKRDSAAATITFRFERPEREMLIRILDLYPLQNSAIRKINDDPATHDLLEKALAEQRAKLRAEADRLLRERGELVIDPEFNEFWDLSLGDADIEALLQMLNDVRVGLWNQIGCPDPRRQIEVKGPPDEELVRAHVIMQICAAWQGVLMQAVRGESDDEDFGPQTA